MTSTTAADPVLLLHRLRTCQGFFKGASYHQGLESKLLKLFIQPPQAVLTNVTPGCGTRNHDSLKGLYYACKAGNIYVLSGRGPKL